MDLIRDYYNYDQHANFADKYGKVNYDTRSDLSNIEKAQYKNSFAHAYVSAMLTVENGSIQARLLGNLREAQTTGLYYLGDGGDYRTDTFRDLYNNAVGRAIGRYAAENKLNNTQVADLVHQSLERGDMILSIDVNNPDPRIPHIGTDYLFDIDPDTFNGWPGDFRPYITDNMWKGTGDTGGDQNTLFFEETLNADSAFTSVLQNQWGNNGSSGFLGTSYDTSSYGFDIGTFFSYGNEGQGTQEFGSDFSSILNDGLLLGGGNWSVSSVTANDPGFWVEMNAAISDGLSLSLIC